jgi:hypothetical protein
MRDRGVRGGDDQIASWSSSNAVASLRRGGRSTAPGIGMLGHCRATRSPTPEPASLRHPCDVKWSSEASFAVRSVGVAWWVVASVSRVREVADPKCRWAGAGRPRWIDETPRSALPGPHYSHHRLGLRLHSPRPQAAGAAAEHPASAAEQPRSPARRPARRPISPTPTRTSRCSRSLTVLASGTRWKNRRGPTPTGSWQAQADPRLSTGSDSSNASQESKPGAVGGSTYPRAAFQNSATTRGSAQSTVT